MNSVFLVGECGTGKTLMGAALAHQVGQQARPNYRVMVVGPPHLTRLGKVGSKWHREIAKTIPGVRILHIETHKGLFRLPKIMAEHPGPIWVICSRNFLKTDPPTRPAYNTKAVRVKKIGRAEDGTEFEVKVTVHAPCCPTCGQPVMDSDGNPKPVAYLLKARRRCKCCGSQLWSYAWPRTRDGAVDRRKPVYSAAHWLKRHVRFDLLIADEVHEMKGGGTAQGQMLGTIGACANKTIALTGTLFGGKASDLYYLMWRLCPDRMKELGFDYHGGVTSFVQQYGILQRVVERDEDVKGSKSKRRDKAAMIEKPGIVPTVFTDLLLDRAAFLSLEDMVPHLPAGALPPRPRIEFELVGLDSELSGPYQSMKNDIEAAICAMGRGKAPPMGLISAMFRGLDCWPDHPFGHDDISVVRSDGSREFVCEPPELPDQVYAKDRRLLEIIKSELAKGRRCLVYTIHTQKLSVSNRLFRYLKANGVRVAILEDVPTDRREEWIDKQLEDGVQVIVTHPGKVETGLDLLAFPTIIFHSVGTKPFTFRQAGARSWRIGQTARCRIILMAYAGTMQETIAGLMFTKIKAATRLEGQVLDDLSSIGAGDDITDQILASIQQGQKVEIPPEALAADPTPRDALIERVPESLKKKIAQSAPPAQAEDPMARIARLAAQAATNVRVRVA